MKKLLREKLLETRRDFLKLKEYEKNKSFLLEMNLNFDKEDMLVITIQKMYENEDNEYINFGKQEIIETQSKEINVFIELMRYAEDKYCEQFIYAIHPFIYCFYGNDMNTAKFEYIVSKGDKSFLSGKMGFAIKENIF